VLQQVRLIQQEASNLKAGSKQAEEKTRRRYQLAVVIWWLSRHLQLPSPAGVLLK